tara:strand:+ start:299 stop:682 length:384 start_codon:yes stop_codon:yes gene_type:complete
MRKIVMYMIIACVILLLTNDFQEGFAGKYILKSKIVPPVCPKCPDLVNVCEPKHKKCPPCKPCGRCPFRERRREERSYEDEPISLLPIPFGLERNHHHSRQERRKDYRKAVKNEGKYVPWLNSFSEF